MIVVGRKIANLTKEQEEAQSFYFDREEAEREFWQVKKLWCEIRAKQALGAIDWSNFIFLVVCRFALLRSYMGIKLKSFIIVFPTTWLNLHWMILIGKCIFFSLYLYFMDY